MLLQENTKQPTTLFYHSFARWSVINIAVGNYSLITSRRKENKRTYYLLDRDWPQNFVSTTKCCKPSKIYSIVLRYFPCFQCCFFLHFTLYLVVYQTQEFVWGILAAVWYLFDICLFFFRWTKRRIFLPGIAFTSEEIKITPKHFVHILEWVGRHTLDLRLSVN